MGLFAQLFAAIMGNLAGFFGQWMTKKVALGAAVVSTFGILTLAMTALIGTSITLLLGLSSIPEMAVVGIRMFMPSQTPLIISTVIAGDAAIAVYRWNVENLKAVSFVT